MAINKNIPVTNREKYLAKIAGEEVSASNPINREDYFLNEIAENEGGGGSGGGNEPLSITMSAATVGLKTTYTLDKTWKEIHDAFPNIIIDFSYTVEGEDYADRFSVDFLSYFGDKYYVVLPSEHGLSEPYFEAGSPNDYPTYIKSNVG